MANPPGDGYEGAALTPASGSASLGSGAQPIKVSQHVGSLAPLTAYRYRPVATAGRDDGRSGTRAPDPGLPTSGSARWPGLGARLPRPTKPAVGWGRRNRSSAAASSSGGRRRLLHPLISFVFRRCCGRSAASQYLSSRGGSGWVSANVLRPRNPVATAAPPTARPSASSPRPLAGGDLNAGRCAVADTCPPSYSLWEGGSFAAVPTLPGLRFEGATEDLSHFVFSADSGLYEWSGGWLETLSATPGARLAAPVGAISTDGQRVPLHRRRRPALPRPGRRHRPRCQKLVAAPLSRPPPPTAGSPLHRGLDPLPLRLRRQCLSAARQRGDRRPRHLGRRRRRLLQDPRSRALAGRHDDHGPRRADGHSQPTTRRRLQSPG